MRRKLEIGIHHPWFKTRPKVSIGDSVRTFAILVACTGIGIWFKHLGFREANIIMIYIVGVLICAMCTGGWICSAAYSVISVLVFNYFFTEPYYSLEAYDPGYPVTFVIMLAVSFLTSTLTMRIREQARHSAQEAYGSEVLLEASRKLQQAKDEPSLIEEMARQLVKLLGRTVSCYPAVGNALSEPSLFQGPDADTEHTYILRASEKRAANWVYRNLQHAGATTGRFPHSACLYYPVSSGNTVFAVAGVAIGAKGPLNGFEQNLMIAMLGECALALEKEMLNRQQEEISLQIQQEQLRSNLLRTISHDLRTPLTSISGNAGILLSNAGRLGEGQKLSLYTNIYEDAVWLIQLVENLLSISRMENGTLNLKLQAELLDEVISEALQHVKGTVAEHHIIVELKDDLLMARMDSRLIAQVLINLVNNAITYTPKGSYITISAKRTNDIIEVEVSDDGPGVPQDAQGKLFDMFYTAGNNLGDGRRGLGLGLALCKSIIEAHGGTIGLRDNQPSGTIFYFTLQAEEVTVYE